MAQSSHLRNDARSLMLHKAIAQKLRASPDPVLSLARQNLQRWQDDEGASYYAREWATLLNGPLDRLLAVLVEEGEYAVALRHMPPFAGALTPQERWTIYRAFREAWPFASRGV